MANTIQHKRGTAAEWTSADPTLAAGEFGYETDTGKLKLGDGSTAWSALGYFEAAEAVAAYAYGGVNNGYAMGGTGIPSSTISTSIEKYSFTTDGNSVSSGSLAVSKSNGAGSKSGTHAYYSGSIGSNGDYDISVNQIEKFSFVDEGTGTDVGDLTVARGATAGNSSETNGYVSGGFRQDPTPVSHLNIIDKFPFAADANATDIGDLLEAKSGHAGQSSTENGYVSGGTPGPVNTIQKFSFTTDGNSTDVGDLIATVNQNSGHSSSTSGYSAGGITPTQVNTIQKFPFAADANATDVADLTETKKEASGSSSATFGYVAGGPYDGAAYSVTIEKFSFTADENATDVGDLINALRYRAGSEN